MGKVQKDNLKPGFLKYEGITGESHSGHTGEIKAALCCVGSPLKTLNKGTRVLQKGCAETPFDGNLRPIKFQSRIIVVASCAFYTEIVSHLSLPALAGMMLA